MNLDLVRIINFGLPNGQPAEEEGYVKHIVSLLKNPTEYLGLTKGAFPEWYSPDCYIPVRVAISEVLDLNLNEAEMHGIAKLLFKRFGHLGNIFHNTFAVRSFNLTTDVRKDFDRFLKNENELICALHHISRSVHEPFYPVREGDLLEKLKDLVEDDNLITYTRGAFCPTTIADIAEAKPGVGTTIGIWGWHTVGEHGLIKVPALRYHVKVME